jgi:hypothetical protein
MGCCTASEGRGAGGSDNRRRIACRAAARAVMAALLGACAQHISAYILPVLSDDRSVPMVDRNLRTSPGPNPTIHGDVA